MFVRQYLTKNGVRYRCNVRDLPGRPDITIKKYKLALNVHGCFRHGHQNCKNFRLPKTNVEFWKTKIETNIKRMNGIEEVYLPLVISIGRCGNASYKTVRKMVPPSVTTITDRYLPKKTTKMVKKCPCVFYGIYGTVDKKAQKKVQERCEGEIGNEETQSHTVTDVLCDVFIPVLCKMGGGGKQYWGNLLYRP